MGSVDYPPLLTPQLGLHDIWDTASAAKVFGIQCAIGITRWTCFLIRVFGKGIFRIESNLRRAQHG